MFDGLFKMIDGLFKEPRRAVKEPEAPRVKEVTVTYSDTRESGTRWDQMTVIKPNPHLNELDHRVEVVNIPIDKYKSVIVRIDGDLR